ncbi:MAG TPA: hypothetical protein VMO81_04445 [Aestuariivirgaceae bacterium]|nr:hypothetical protein [Aestuariivirgaceae bacterium]
MPDWSNHELIVAGWSRDDLDWEDAAAAHCAALASSDSEALAHSGACLLRARESFTADDPRLATSLANHAASLARRGDAVASGLWREAWDAWPRCKSWIAGMSAPRVARSSLFHMRMEQRHRDIYEERWRLKWRDMAETAGARLLAADPAVPIDPATAAAALARWHRECPAMLNDTRKLMAATLFLLPGH